MKSLAVGPNRGGSIRLGRALAAVALSALALTVLSVTPALAVAPAWLSPTPLSAPAEGSREPQIAIDSEGDAVAIWQGAGEVVQSATRPAGATWSAPEELSAPDEKGREPQVTVDPRGDAVAVWLAVGAGETFVESASRSPGGTWSAPEALSAPAPFGGSPQVALNAEGDAVAIWDRGSSFHTVVESATRPAGGAWSPAEELSSAPSEIANGAQVAIDPQGNSVAVWQQGPFSPFTALAATLAAGGSWSSPHELALGSEPEVAIDPEGNATAVWTAFSVEASIQFATHPAASGWSTSKDLSTPGVNQFQIADRPDVAIDPDGDAVAVWEGFDESGGELRLVIQGASRPAGGDWSAEEDLSPLSEYSFGAPRVALDPDGDAIAVWQYEGSDGFFIQSATLQSGGTWSDSQNLTTGGAVYSPGIAVDPQGDAVAVWERLQAGGKAIAETAAYDATAPQLRDLVIPATGTVGQPVSFSVSPFDVSSPTTLVGWSFGDGAAATGPAVSHVYARPGTYPVTLTGTDAAGNTTAASGTIAIAAAPSTNAEGTPGEGGGGAGTGVTERKRSTATAAGIAKVIRGKAQLKLRCGGEGECSGSAMLTYRPKQGKPKSAKDSASRRSALLGKTSFEIPAATAETIPVKLNSKAKKLLGEAGKMGLKVRLAGSGVTGRAMTLKNTSR